MAKKTDSAAQARCYTRSWQDVLDAVDSFERAVYDAALSGQGTPAEAAMQEAAREGLRHELLSKIKLHVVAELATHT
jgi:hypothetical protein